MYKANIHITLRPSILDPQGKATHQALVQLGFQEVEQVRIGKYIELWVEATDAAEAERVARQACEKLLANPVMEDFTISLEPVASGAAG
ncbi:phosphoribosylformylglycinamidine synthase subunit PurS [Rhodocaloribacter litoris]|uniref:phosphoribosylformylglycinamidine synthase subunit PurS n=1 Tax=Rhodocaloribacter litoris TaxID=2558931 RepID=UPI00142240DF|nr:phosphoribosylformylglycinamidine synthase subunit PurS [Rhodocaloribacter litoris]QXD14989.1 phosphoribosylformylglycinamidine synthase subunit PurS [Rhodocaloribacter litoris]